MERILGSTGSRRRRRYQLAAIFSLVALLGALAALPAQAIHAPDDTSFELDGNFADTPSNGLDDWANVFDGTDSANVSTGIIADPLGDTIFTGGGSKDALDIPSWQHKSGSVPPKDEISDAYAALYVVDGELRLYFGADRFAQNGASQIGFWFFQNEVSLNSDGTFSGVHVARDPATGTPGDILILSDFTVGGTISTIRVFEWVGSGGSDGAVDQIGAGLDCTVFSHPPSQEACGTVNGTLLTGVPWTYTPKFGAAQTFPPGSMYEGGVDLTQLGIGNICISSFLAETRSSPSVDATLKDFVLGAFPECVASVETTPSPASIQLGDSITDTAVVTGEGPGTPPAPTGTVDFFICSPAQLTGGVCSSDGTLVSDDVPLSPSGPSSSTATSGPFTPDTVGTWCWRGEYSGDGNYDPATDASAGECFTVTDVTETVTAQNWRPNDSATITSTGGSAVSGSVAFTLYDNGTCDGSVLYTETVPASGASPQTANTTNDGSDPSDVLVSADAIVSWQAVFTSDDPNVQGSTSHCELSTLTIDNDITTP